MILQGQITYRTSGGIDAKWVDISSISITTDV